MQRIFASVKGSLDRLGLEYIDLLQCHRWDPETPIEETMEALHDVVKSGMVRYIGMSSCWAWQFQLMQRESICDQMGWDVDDGRIRYSEPPDPLHLYAEPAQCPVPRGGCRGSTRVIKLTGRQEEREMMPMLKHFGVGVIPWGPVAAGRR